MKSTMIKSKPTAGFTLLELMIALVIAAILLAAAVPSFQGQIRNSRMSAASNDLVSSLMTAKSESVARNNGVSICKRNVAGTGCLTTGGWEQGWIIFVDTDADGTVDGEEILYLHEALPSSITARGTSLAANRVIYRPNGLTNLTNTQAIVLCDERGFGVNARGIIITILGRSSSMIANETSQTGCLV